MRDRKIVRKLLEESDGCDLCGYRRNLEVHHIIPLVCAPPGVDIDCEENMIVLCPACHGKLTPRGLLTKIGMQNSCHSKDPYKRFLEKIEHEGYEVSASDVFGFAQTMAEEFICNR